MVGDAHATFEAARTDASKSDAIAMGGVHVGLDLEDEGRERAFECAWRIAAI